MHASPFWDLGTKILCLQNFLKEFLTEAKDMILMRPETPDCWPHRTVDTVLEIKLLGANSRRFTMTTDLASDSVKSGTQQSQNSCQQQNILVAITNIYVNILIHIYMFIYICMANIHIPWLSIVWAPTLPDGISQTYLHNLTCKYSLNFSSPLLLAGTLLLNKFQPGRLSAILRQEALKVCLLPSTQFLAR